MVKLIESKKKYLARKTYNLIVQNAVRSTERRKFRKDNYWQVQRSFEIELKNFANKPD
jgi:hypothetical protein